jgi:hypothetical protein
VKGIEMANETINDQRRQFLGTSALVLTGAIAGVSSITMPTTASAQFSAAKEPAVVGYPNEKGVTIERVTYKARNMGADMSEQRSREARGEAVQLVPVVPDAPDAFNDKRPPMYREGQQYYRTAHGQHPGSANRYMFSSLPLQMAFFPFDHLTRSPPYTRISEHFAIATTLAPFCLHKIA